MFKYIIYSFSFITLCCFTNKLNGQSAPGLLGKRLCLSYDFNTHYNYMLGDSPYRNLLTNKHLFGIDFILSRTLSIGLDYGFHNERLDNVIFGPDNQYLRHNLNSNEIGLRLKYFPVTSGSITPIGPYLQFRVLHYSYSSEMEFIPYDITNNLDESFAFLFEEESTIAGSFGFGRQGIITRNIIYNIGCEMGLVLTQNAPRSSLNAPQKDIRDSLIIGNLFKLKIGIAVPIY